MSEYHRPVMLNECIGGLDLKENGTYVDLTFFLALCSHLNPTLVAFLVTSQATWTGVSPSQPPAAEEEQSPTRIVTWLKTTSASSIRNR